jgi:ubiquinone/menaquinone biosynthesis C-methylase UbiE
VSIGRRKVSLSDPSAWVFNKMVDAYATRPAYPDAVLAALTACLPAQARVLDIGAGLGHLALPLARCGFRVTAVEPAIDMLGRLQQLVVDACLPVTLHHAQAEELPLADSSFELIVLADALHFIDSERAAREMARVLAPKGQLAVLSWELSDTPFNQALRRIMQEAAPRRPRDVKQAIVEVFAVAGKKLPLARHFHDAFDVSHDELETLLRSISFIGPAMNTARFDAFQARVRAIPHLPAWSRDLTLYQG